MKRTTIQCKKSWDSSYYGSNFTYLRHNTPCVFRTPPPCPYAMLPKKTYCIPQGTTITRVQHCLGGRGILIEQRHFFLILLFDMQILTKNISFVATILLRIVATVYYSLYLSPTTIRVSDILNLTYQQYFSIAASSYNS